MFKRLFKIKRYFIVSYTFKNGDNGFINVINNAGEYTNKFWIQNMLTEELKSKHDVGDVGNIVINNIIELSKKDYMDFIKED